MNLNFSLANLKRWKWRKTVYPAILIMLTAAVIAVFTSSAAFLSDAINGAFRIDEQAAESRVVRLSIGDLEVVGKKLGLVILPASETEGAALPLAVQPAQAPAPAPAPTSTQPAAQLDKALLKIAVMNSTATPGRAGTLRDHLVKEGFTVAKVGNLSPALDKTVIRIKDSKKDYSWLLQDAVGKLQVVGGVETLAESDANDAVVVIGKE